MDDGSGRRLLAALCLAEILGMSGASTFAALLPVLRAQWSLSAAQAGWISGIYYLGYLLAVPVLVGLTDRIDRRIIYLLSTAVGAVSGLAFALASGGFWTAFVLRALAGISLAGTYMPGLKALTDRAGGPLQSRSVAIYTSSFGVGVSLSFVTSGAIGAALGWRWAFGASAIGSILAYTIAAAAIEPARCPHPPGQRKGALSFREITPVLRDRAVIGYTLAYAAHAFELFGLRSWAVAFFSFALATHPGTSAPAAGSLVAAAMTAIGIPASIGGNEIALKIGRMRLLTLAMLISAAAACLVGFTAPLPIAVVALVLLIYGGLVASDSATLTAGLVDISEPTRRGMTMAVYSFVGFFGAFLGPLVFGLVLQRLGSTNVVGWGLAFATMGIVAALGPLALRASRQVA